LLLPVTLVTLLAHLLIFNFKNVNIFVTLL
jgi:hypothetical protein